MDGFLPIIGYAIVALLIAVPLFAYLAKKSIEKDKNTTEEHLAVFRETAQRDARQMGCLMWFLAGFVVFILYFLFVYQWR